MANFVFDAAKGKVRYFAELGAAADALILIPLETTGLESDAVLTAKANVSTLLSGSTNEQTTLGRKTLTSVTVGLAAGVLTIDAADTVWIGGNGNPCSKIVICYDDDTGAGDDTNLIPLLAYDAVFDPIGTDVTVAINALGLYTVTAA